MLLGRAFVWELGIHACLLYYIPTKQIICSPMWCVTCIVDDELKSPLCELHFVS